MSTLLTLRRPNLLFTRAETKRERDASKLSSTTPPRLQNFEDLPEWYQDNPSVRTAYRPVSFSLLACLESWVYLHNESLNIYTHLLPALLSLPVQLLVQVWISQHFPEASMVDRSVFAANIFAVTTCMMLSTLYHTLMNHSMKVSFLWLGIDYVGILSLILGSFFSGIFVGFYCEPALRRTYWGMIVSLSLGTSVLVLHPRLQGLKYRSIRTIAFVMTGLSGFAPVGHGLIKYGWEEMWVRSGMPYWFLEGAFYGVGALFFAIRVPESIWPGRFDVWGSSHQIFHVLVVMGSLVHLLGVWEAYKWNYTHMAHCKYVP
ncbi:HlyIII-domain-containing protein [Aulographum hederae CBS 113979]|uniref:HlyIII-domain-containing protein n=1 Tax=Aulographum hederae CBS 113979 TaxID=1176131 RepID=A0A6G1H9U8_9PEZI|nr:HlyIII-domain-containing protein [Aulographum hederae CBS 113979]